MVPRSMRFWAVRLTSFLACISGTEPETPDGNALVIVSLAIAVRLPLLLMTPAFCKFLVDRTRSSVATAPGKDASTDAGTTDDIIAP